MKIYPQTYEKVFTGKRALGKLNWDQITISGDEPVALWGKKLKDLVREDEMRQFDFLVKFVWLVRRFKRNGLGWRQNVSSGMAVSGALGAWAKNYGNFHFLKVTNEYINKKIFSYLDDFFPEFDMGNPFESRYNYPYEHMGFSHLFLVYQMPERLELLQYGEEHRMSYAQFSDWILNYILNYNEDHGETYRFIFSTFTIPYIKAINRKIYERRNRGYRTQKT